MTKKSTQVGGIAGDRLKSFVERIENLETEKKALSDDIAEVFSEAKGAGFNTKVLRKLIALGKQDEKDRAEERQILDLYIDAIGMTPLEAAIDKAAA